MANECDYCVLIFISISIMSVIILCSFAMIFYLVHNKKCCNGIEESNNIEYEKVY